MLICSGVRPYLSLLLAALGGSCAGGSVPADDSTLQNGVAQEHEATQEWMRSHFVKGRAIRDALARGELDDARAQLGEMSAEPGPAGAPPSWEPRLEALRAAASEAATARGLPDVAGAFGDVASQCAGCHEAIGAEPAFDSPDLPEARAAAPAPMQRHQWAAERMWQGLVGPAPERYREGALILAEAPLHPGEVVVGRSPPLEVVQLAERVRDIAGQASRAEAQAERAALYGQLLATCAGCHSQL